MHLENYAAALIAAAPEGVDVKNACFGGTQAVFHAIDWVYANYSMEKRNAIAVLADIAVYEPGPARSTGGAGAIAVLITPDAPIAFDRGLRATYMASSWDFYKPIGKTCTEYPIVDGPVSLQSYMNALDSCYVRYKEKAMKIYGEDISLSSFSAAMFHSPFTRMVQKAVARLTYRDYENGKGEYGSSYSKLGVLSQSSFEDREVMRSLLSGSEPLWQQKTNPFLVLNRRIGNMYTPSLFAQLVAYLASGAFDDLCRILFFAYGSGSASAMFSAKICDRTDNRLSRMQAVCHNAISRLDERLECTPEIYSEAMKMREIFLASEVPVTPKANGTGPSSTSLFPGTYYLKSLDEKYRRSYEVLPYRAVSENHENGITNGIQGEGDS
ncbi:putative hydroxymethylglutaryl-CoA synthase [Ostertagia ostertagi]